jgi:hypothetical protein
MKSDRSEMTVELVVVPVEELLDLSLAHEAEFGRSSLGDFIGRFLDANRGRAEKFNHPLGYVERIDGPRGEKPALVLVDLSVSERDKDLGREACAVLARATWFAEYLERKFATIRAEEREECADIAEHMADWSEVADSSTGYAIAKRIRERANAR